MGNQPTKRQSKEIKTQKQAVRSHIQDQRVETLSQFQQTILQNTPDTQESQQKAYMMYSAAETAKEQLARDGKQFTKTDLVAIVKLIDPSKNLAMLRVLSCDDLRAIIRGKIYNIEKYLPSNTENENMRIENAGTLPNPDLEEIPTIQRRKKSPSPSSPPPSQSQSQQQLVVRTSSPKSSPSQSHQLVVAKKSRQSSTNSSPIPSQQLLTLFN